MNNQTFITFITKLEYQCFRNKSAHNLNKDFWHYKLLNVKILSRKYVHKLNHI